MTNSKLPTTKEELFKMIDRHVKVDERKELAFAEDLSDYHWGLGLWIRNRFVCPSNGEVGSLLGKGGVYGPADVVSEEILRAYQRYLYERYDTPKAYEVRCTEMGDESDYHIRYFHTREEAQDLIDARDPQDCLYETWYVAETNLK